MNHWRRTLASLALGLAVIMLAVWCVAGGSFSTGDHSDQSTQPRHSFAPPVVADSVQVQPEVVSAATVDLTSAQESPGSRIRPVVFAGDTEASDSRSSESESSTEVKSTSFDDIKFEMKKDEKFKQRMITEKINDLFGKTIRIRGYILPSFKQKGLTQFVLVRDNMECCFGPGAALYDCVIVEMAEGRTATFSVRPVTVEGKFTFQKLEDPVDGALRAIYHLDGMSVK